MARVMLHNKNLPLTFWGEAVFTACYLINRVYLRSKTLNTPYELCYGRKPNLSYLRVFGSKCYILKHREHRGIFDSKSDEGIFLGYASYSRAFWVYNVRTKVMMESINVISDFSQDNHTAAEPPPYET